MDSKEKNRLSQEAKLQTRALEQIYRWKTFALFVSAIGVALAYAGFTGAQRNLFFAIPGVLLILSGFGSAAVFNLGLRNGKRNVEKIWKILEVERKHEI